jgi:hypothetical protein
LSAIDDYQVTKEVDGDVCVLTCLTLKAADKLWERAEEIVAAYDKWAAEHHGKPKGYATAKRAYDKADSVETKIQDQILSLKATTLEGMIAKSRCAEVYEFDDTAGFSVSIAEDLVALGAKIARIAAVA